MRYVHYDNMHNHILDDGFWTEFIGRCVFTGNYSDSAGQSVPVLHGHISFGWKCWEGGMLLEWGKTWNHQGPVFLSLFIYEYYFNYFFSSQDFRNLVSRLHKNINEYLKSNINKLIDTDGWKMYLTKETQEQLKKGNSFINM